MRDLVRLRVEEVIARTSRPATVKSLRDDLHQLGLVQGVTVLVHSSLSNLDWVVGGAHAVVLALLETVEATGTIVMPTQTNYISDPSLWTNPPVPNEWWTAIRENFPAFDQQLSPTSYMGAVVECFRHVPGVLRSSHPKVSFAAVGPRAVEIVRDHELANPLGERSPLARLYELDAQVLLLGTTHEHNTSLHLAEYRATYPSKAWVTQGAPVLIDGQRKWVEYPDLHGDSSDFESLGHDFAKTGLERQAQVCGGGACLMRQREVVDFAVQWLEEHRK
jgi:aminoglycoside 3-N-acetyltransferase